MTRLFESICPKFTKYVFEQCISMGIKTVTDFILHDPEDLARKINVPYKDALSIHHTLVVNYAGFPQNAISLQCELLDTISILNTGSESLNKYLSGGIYTGEVTEIYGSSGSGKTQFSFSLISELILKTKNTALYLDTNGSFSAMRLKEIILEKCKRENTNNSQDAVAKLQNLKVKGIYDIYDLFDCLELLRKEINESENVFTESLKMVVIDSITPLLSSCLGDKNLDGLDLMNNISHLLNLLSSENKLSILVCNNAVQDKDDLVKPALGLNWKYMPSVSLHIDKLNNFLHHRIRAVKSCRNSLSGEVIFCISKAGIMNCDIPAE